jgi:hypothetical protein
LVEWPRKTAPHFAVNCAAARVGLLHSGRTVVSVGDATISVAVNELPAMIGNSAFSSAVCHQEALVPALLATGAASSEVT